LLAQEVAEQREQRTGRLRRHHVHGVDQLEARIGTRLRELLAGGGRRTLSKRPATTMVGRRISLARCVTLGRAIARFMEAKQTGSCAR
jgi:hypothetical protein